MAVKTGFWKKVADSDYVQLLSVAGTVAGVAEFLVGLFVDDPTETILRRIDELERAIQQGLAAIGDLINRQTEIIHQEFNTHDSETALSHAFAAAGLIFTYKDLGLQDAIIEADGWSLSAVGLMLAQPPDPFFIGGLIGAGNTRIDVIRALDPEFYSKPFRIGEIFDLADRLETLVSIVKQRVDRSHTVVHRRVPIEGELEPPAVRPGERPVPPMHWITEHRSGGVVIDEVESGPPGTAVADRARELAEDARRRGIGAEQEALGVPQFEHIVALWRSVPEQHMLQAMMRRFAARPRQRFDMDMARKPRFFVKAIRRTPRRPSIELEGVGKPDRSGTSSEASAWELTADVRPFVVDVVSSTEFRKKFLEPAADAKKVVELLASRILGRDVTGDETTQLVALYKRLGFSSLAAALVYSNEYGQSVVGPER